MSAFTQRKNKIVLSDYPYHRDMEHRLLFANISSIDVMLLKELFHYSLVIPLTKLSEELELSETCILDRLAKFAPLLQMRLEGSCLILDKERRRYFETEMEKFDAKFQPGMEYLQELLKKVPPFVLPIWYQLPRQCERIFSTIIDKFFVNPKIYQLYLKELQFNQPTPRMILEAVLAAPDYKVDAISLMKSLSLTPHQFHEAVLLLEFHLACCLSYECVGEEWRQIVTPFQEWRDYLLFHRDTAAPSISDPGLIRRTHPNDFGFVEDLSLLLQRLKRGPVRVVKEEMGWTMDREELMTLFPHQPSSSYVHSLIAKVLLMHLADIEKTTLHILERAEEWLMHDVPTKAMTMTRHPIQVEKGLRRVLQSGWVYVSDFLRGFTGIFRDKEPIVLKNIGRQWRYQLPSYNEEELILIQTTLCHRLFEAGIVATGVHEGCPCFCVTPFGQSLF
jgi:hypothetical protein